MNKAIAVFDAGLGSYAIVEAIKKAYPKQQYIFPKEQWDETWFADPL